MNHQTSTVPQVIPQVAYQSPQAPTQLMTKSPFVDSCFVVPVFSPGDDPIACLNKAMAFLTVVASSRFLTTNNQLRTSSNLRNQATIQDGRVTVQQVQGRQGQNYSGNTYKSNATSSKGNTTSGQARVVKCYNCQDPGIPASQTQTVIPHNAAFQTEDFDTYDSDCDDLSTTHTVLMANISNYGSEVISEATVQDTNLQAQQDSMILSVIEQMINHVNNWEKANKEQNNESINDELEIYKESVKTFEQRLNIDLSSLDVPSELPKVSLVNASLKKLKFHLTQFDSVVKKRTTPSALEEVSMQLKQEVFQNDESCVNQNAVEIQEYFEIKDLKAQIQDKVFVITSLKNNLRKSKGKEIVENVVHIPSATTIAPGMFKLDLVSLPPRLLQNREVHINYLRNTQEQANILQEIVEQVKAKQPLDGDLDLACKYATRIQELLVYVQDTCPNAITPSTKKVVVTPMNNVKKVRLAEPLTSSSNIKQVESSNTSDSNTPVLSSTGVKCSTSICGSKPPGNKKNDRISQTPSRNKKNKVEAQPRKVNKMNHVVKPVCDVDVKQSLSNANSDILCATCNKSMFDGVHDKCLLDLVRNGNNHAKSAKKHKNQNIWKPTGHVFTEVGFKWKPTGRTFTIVGNSCPLTRLSKIVLWYLDSGCSKHMTGNRSQLMNFVSKFWVLLDSKRPNCKDYGGMVFKLGIVLFKVYYVEGLGHNLFSVG
ncbi:hypothetical protein Tco_0962513 [Tanacetum coccineum]